MTFDANTKESDYDVVVAVTSHNLKEDFNDLRRVKFFCELPKILASQQMLVFAVWLAKNPILKIWFKSELWVDVSIAFIN